MSRDDAVVVGRVARRLINAGAVDALRHLQGMNDAELALLADCERRSESMA